MADEIGVLTSGPLPPDEVAHSLYLYSEDITLGPTSETKRIIEGLVKVGKHRLFPIANPPTIDADEWNFFLAQIPISLQELPGDKTLQEVNIRVRLDHEAATAYDLFPPTTYQQHDSERVFGLTPSMKFGWLNVDANLSYRDRFESLQPTITVFNIGTDDFYWKHEASPVHLGTKWALIVLQVPRDLVELPVAIRIEAQVKKGWGDLLRTVPTYAEAVEKTFKLR